MPDSWVPKRLADVARIEIGGTPSRNEPRFWAAGDGGYPWVAISDLQGKYIGATAERITETGVRNSNVKPVPAGTPVMSFKLSIGRAALTRLDLFTNEAIAAFHAHRDHVDPHWLYYVLPRAAAGGVTDAAIKGATLNKAKLNDLALTVPPLPEQRRIAEILDTLDDLILSTEQLIAKLKQVKQGLLHDLFTRGIDENGELRDPGRHPEQFKDSPLGRIPKAWEVAELGAGIAFITDYRGHTPPYSDEGVPVISAENVGDGRIKSITKYVTWETYRRTSTRGFPEPDDTIFTTEAPVGEVARVPSNGTYRLTRRVLALRPSGAFWEKPFVFWFVYWRSRSGAWAPYMHGSTVPRILKPDILARKIAKPPLPEQRQIGRILDEHEQRVEREARYLAKLKTLKSGLMEDLLTGRVRVTDLENAA